MIYYIHVCPVGNDKRYIWSLYSHKLFEIAIVTSSVSFVGIVNHCIILHYVATCYIQVNMHSLNYINCQKFWLLLSG